MFLYFVSESPNLTRIQTHHLCIGHVTLIKYKYRQLYDKGKENERTNWFAKFIAMYLSSCTCIDYFSFFLSHVSVWLFAKFTVWFVAILGKIPR